MTDPLTPTPVVSTRRFPWWIPLTVGILVVLAGLGLLIWPFIAATWILVVLFGSALIANGLAMLVRQRPSAGSTIAGVLLIAAGILAMIFSNFTVNALVTFVGVALIIVGLFWAVIGVRGSGAGSAAVVLPAILTLLGGIVTLIWPEFAIKIVAVICGIFTLVLGSTLIWTAILARKVRMTTRTIVL